MGRSISEILDDIDAFVPIDGDWLPLDRLLDELWQHDISTSAIPLLFRVFEKFPDDDGSGVLWSLAHWLETRDDYESALRNSLSRQPSLMGKIMLRRLQESETA